VRTPAWVLGAVTIFGVTSEANAISDLDDNGGRSPPPNQAFLYTNGTMFDLNSLLSPQQASLYTLTNANGINNAGQIVAIGYFDVRTRSRSLIGPGGPDITQWRGGCIARSKAPLTPLTSAAAVYRTGDV
jgi:hypothetical protein